MVCLSRQHRPARLVGELLGVIPSAGTHASGRRDPELSADRTNKSRAYLTVARHRRRPLPIGASPLRVTAALGDPVRVMSGQMTLEIAELHAENWRCNSTVSSAASPASGESIIRSASTTL